MQAKAAALCVAIITAGLCSPPALAQSRTPRHQETHESAKAAYNRCVLSGIEQKNSGIEGQDARFRISSIRDQCGQMYEAEIFGAVPSFQRQELLQNENSFYVNFFNDTDFYVTRICISYWGPGNPVPEKSCEKANDGGYQSVTEPHSEASFVFRHFTKAVRNFQWSITNVYDIRP